MPAQATAAASAGSGALADWLQVSQCWPRLRARRLLHLVSLHVDPLMRLDFDGVHVTTGICRLCLQALKLAMNCSGSLAMSR